MQLQEEVVGTRKRGRKGSVENVEWGRSGEEIGDM